MFNTLSGVRNTSTTIVVVRYLCIERLLFCVVTVLQLRSWTVLCYVHWRFVGGHCGHDSQVQLVMFTVTSVSRSASSRPRRTVAYSSTAFTAPPRSPVWAFSPDRAARTLPELCPAGNGAYVVSGYRPAPRQRVYGSDRNRNLVDIHIVAICRLRADGYSVVERAQPHVRRAVKSLRLNHGGVTIVAAAGVCLTPVDIGNQPTTFECVAACVLSGSSSSIVVVYRPGSTAITATFFLELADLLDRLMTFTDPIVLAGDINIRLERTTDPNVVEFSELLSSYGLV